MMRDEDEGFVMLGRVVGDKSARFKHRWFGILQVETEEGQILSLYKMSLRKLMNSFMR